MLLTQKVHSQRYVTRAIHKIGSFSETVCTTATSFSSKAELKSAVDSCLKLNAKGDSSNGRLWPTVQWYV